METKEITSEDWIRLLLGTICEEWGSVETWGTHVHSFEHVDGTYLREYLPYLIDTLKKYEAEIQ